MRGRASLGRVVICAVLASTGCKQTVEETRSVVPLDVDFAGCARVAAGPTCHILEATTLALWLPIPEEVDVSVFFDGRPATFEENAIDDGTQLVLDVARAGSLEVRTREADRAGSWSLKIVESRMDAALAKVDALRNQGELEEALEVATSRLDAEDDFTRALALGRVGRLHLARGDDDAAIEHLSRSLALHEASGHVSNAVLDRCALAYVYLRSWRYEEALTALHPVEAHAKVDPSASVFGAYHEALLAQDYGDLRRALRLQDRAIALARRLRLARLEADASNIRIAVLHGLGRYDDTSDSLEFLAKNLPEERGCARAGVLNNLGWYLTTNAEAGFPMTVQGRAALEWLTDSRDEYEKWCSEARPDLANVLVSLAQEHVRLGNLTDARALVVQAGRVDPEPQGTSSVTRRIVEAEIGRRTDNAAEALKTYEWLGTYGMVADSALYSWQAALGRGRVLRQLGRTDEALVAFDGAEDIVDRRLAVVPLGDGRFQSALAFIESAIERIDLLLAMDRVDEAVAAARRSRRRTFAGLQWSRHLASLTAPERTAWYAALASYRQARRALEARTGEDWTLSGKRLRVELRRRQKQHAQTQSTLQNALALLGRSSTYPEELDRPAEQELLLVYHRRHSGHWGLALGPTESRAVALPLEASNDALVEPFLSSIETARRILIVPASNLIERDLHTARHAGVPVFAKKVVEYSLDLPPQRPTTAAAGTGALLIVDPRKDLGAAHTEAEIVRKAWKERGYVVTELVGEAATFEAVRRAIESPSIMRLHYAGHADFAGLDGAESGLALAGGTRLTLTDILALARVPPEITLSGCQTGTSHDNGKEAFSLAGAFLVAGAERCTAATATISDEATATEFAQIYGAGALDGRSDVPGGFRIMVPR